MVKKQSIASFIEKLPMGGSVGDCESTLLMTNLDYTGSGSNGDGCTNADRDTCTFSVNEKKCINAEKACLYASNATGCMNAGKVDPPANTGDCLCGTIGG